MHPGVSSEIPQDMDVLREASHALEYVDEMVADTQQALEEERDTEVSADSTAWDLLITLGV